MPHDAWTPMIISDHSLRKKVAHVELLRGLARPVPRYAVSVIYRNILSSEKKAKPKTKK